MPFAIAAAITYWNSRNAVGDFDFLEKGIVNFFAVGWAFSQWNRIKKQKRNEDGLDKVAKTVDSITVQLDAAAERLAGYSTGGNGFCYVMPTYVTALVPATFALLHDGPYPVYDIAVRIVDLGRLSASDVPYKDSMFENQYDFNVLIPQHSRQIVLNSPSPERSEDARDFNIYISARNGSWIQRLAMRRVNGIWVAATEIEKDGKSIYRTIEPTFPLNPEGEVAWRDSYHV